MTEEELKKVEENVNLLVKNGIVVKNPDVFIRESSGVNLEQVIARLTTLRESIDSGIDLSEFAKDMNAGFDLIEETINNDNYFKSNVGAPEFVSALNAIKDKFKLAKNYLKAEEILKTHEMNYRDVQKRIHDLKTDASLDDLARTTESVRLSMALSNAANAKKESAAFCAEQKKLFEASLTNFNVVDFKNDLLKSINALDDACRKLSIDPKTMERLTVQIRDLRDMIVVLGLESQKSQREFDALCERYGFEYTGKKTLNLGTKPKDKEVKTEPIKPQIKNVSELIESVKELNPEVEISVKKKEQNGEMIDYLEITDDASELKLPEGFKYTEGLGINNKVSDTEPYIAVGVGQPKKKESVIDKLKGKKDSKVPSGKQRVKRTRNAIIEPYGKALLCGAAIPGIALLGANTLLGLAVPAILPVAAIGAGFSVAMQALYTKIVKDRDVDIPAFENTRYQNTPEDALWILGAWKAQVPKLMEKYRARKSEIKAKKMQQTAGAVVNSQQPALEDSQKETTNAEDFARGISEKLDSQIEDQFGLGGR